MLFFPLGTDKKNVISELWNLYDYFTLTNALLKSDMWNNIKRPQTFRNLGSGTKRETNHSFKACIKFCNKMNNTDTWSSRKDRSIKSIFFIDWKICYSDATMRMDNLSKFYILRSLFVCLLEF